MSTLGLDLVYGTTDSVTIDIPIHLSGADIPLEFYICRKKDLKQKMQTLSHLGNFVRTSNTKNYRLSDSQLMDKNSLIIMSEHDEIANHMIDSEIGSTFLKFGHLVQEVHFTDQKLYNGFPLFMRATLSLPTRESDQESVEGNFMLLQALLRLADNSTTLRLSSTVASKCEKARKKAKQEEAQ
jgi:hypothetical protein